jgi:hypothetical protein
MGAFDISHDCSRRYPAHPGSHRGDSQLPHMAPARDPPMWDCCDAQAGEETQIGPDWDLEAQPAPD